MMSKTVDNTTLPHAFPSPPAHVVLCCVVLCCIVPHPIKFSATTSTRRAPQTGFRGSKSRCSARSRAWTRCQRRPLGCSSSTSHRSRSRSQPEGRRRSTDRETTNSGHLFARRNLYLPCHAIYAICRMPAPIDQKIDRMVYLPAADGFLLVCSLVRLLNLCLLFVCHRSCLSFFFLLVQGDVFCEVVFLFILCKGGADWSVYFHPRLVVFKGKLPERKCHAKMRVLSCRGERIRWFRVVRLTDGYRFVFCGKSARTESSQSA